MMIDQTTRAERLMEHIRVLCEEIGARPAGSRQERRAAEYVRQQLWALKVEDVRDQTFNAPRTPMHGYMPFLLTAALAVPIGRLGRFGKVIGGTALLSAFVNLRDLLSGKPPLYTAVVEAAESQNVFARIAPTGDIQRRVIVLAHLDTSKQRFTLPLPFPPLTRPVYTLMLSLAGVAGLSMLWSALTGRKSARGLENATALATFKLLAAAAFDETQPYVEGANANASGVAVALELAAALRAAPLEHTEVTLLFTGSAESGNVGIEKYLEQHAPPVENTYWIDLEMVGSGSLCYVTRHGLSLFSDYRPAPRITAMAAKVTRQRPELRVKGKTMTTLDEVAPLVRQGYEAICIAGYDELGAKPNWNRMSDTVDAIEPETLSRAHEYTERLIREIDQSGR